jgi:hypothetical protein
MASSHTLDQLDICFDDTHAVANAGLLLPATPGLRQSAGMSGSWRASMTAASGDVPNWLCRQRHVGLSVRSGTSG